MNKTYSRHVYLSLLTLAFLVLTSVFILPAANTTSSLPAPPVAKKEPKTTEVNGRKLVDNYYWLREKKNPEVKAYLEAENVYTDAVMKPTEPLQKKLYGEMLSRIKETDVEVPYKDGAYFYYVRTEAGKQYGIRCRKKGSMDAPEEILLDVNELAKGQKFMSLGAFEVSDDGNLLAYSTDNTGFRQFTLAKISSTTPSASTLLLGPTTTKPSSIPLRMPFPSVPISCIVMPSAHPAPIRWSTRKKTKGLKLAPAKRAAKPTCC
jgi:oligopeptidase B